MGFDILQGENVDVVGDAHTMSRQLTNGHFNATMSLSVFEHLAMPWKVVLEMNKVMALNGVAYIQTHQSWPLHDTPWDFWRFSDTSWDALFNAHTGFEIVERAMDREHFIVPFIWRPDKADAEQAAGFEGSAVLVRKTGPCRLSWPMTPGDVTTTMYPDGTL